MKDDKKTDEIKSEEYKEYIERLSDPPAPIKISEEQLEELLLKAHEKQFD